MRHTKLLNGLLWVVNVLAGAAVTVLREGVPGGSRGPIGTVLEMSGVAAEGTLPLS
jgi:hypothetical protein